MTPAGPGTPNLLPEAIVSSESARVGHGSVTIIRVFRALAKPGVAAVLEQRLREDVIPEVAAAAGLVAYYAGRPHGDSREFVMVTVWRDLEAVRAFAGEAYEQPVVYADTADLIEEMSLHHYEGV